MKKIAVIGAGISGLSAAFLLSKHLEGKASICVYEKQAQGGGWIKTQKENDYLFELGPRGFRPKGNGEATIRLVKALGIEGELIGADLSAKKRFLYWNKHLHAVPSSLLSFFTSPLTKGVLSALLKEFRVPRTTHIDESIESFVKRRFGSDILQRFVAPLVSGIYAGDPRELSVRSCLPYFWNMEQQYGSLTKAGLTSFIKGFFQAKSETTYWNQFPLLSFKSGMQTLVDSLALKLKGKIHYSKGLESISSQPDGSLRLQFTDFSNESVDDVLLALPADRLAGLFDKQLDLPLFTSLSGIAGVSLGFKDSVLPCKGFGHLVPPGQGENVLGMVWDSDVFPEQNMHSQETRITAMLGGSLHLDLLEKSDSDLTEITLRALHEHLGVRQKPDCIKLWRAKQAIPQYLFDHHNSVSKLESKLLDFHPRVRLLGNAYFGVGVNDCVARSEQVVNRYFSDY